MYPGIAIAVGVVLGAAIGAVSHHMSAWLATGAGIGAAIEVWNYYRKFIAKSQASTPSENAAPLEIHTEPAPPARIEKVESTQHSAARERVVEPPAQPVRSGPKKYSQAPGQINSVFGDEAHEFKEPDGVTTAELNEEIKDSDPHDD